MSLWMEKLLVLFILLGLALISALVPFKLVLHCDSSDNPTWRRHILDWLNCFSGGVFLSTMLLHLFPEVSQGFHEVLEYYGIASHLPFAELSIACGFFFVLFLEVLLTKASDRIENKTKNLEPQIRYSQNGDIHLGIGSIPSITSQECKTKSERPMKETSIDHESVTKNVPKANEFYPLLQSERLDCSEESSSSRVHILRSFVLLAAVTVHTLFEGLMLGLTKSSQTLWKLFAAIVIHKCAVGFSLGSKFAENFSCTVRTVAYMAVFASMSPLGIALGIGITESSSAGNFGTVLAGTILRGLATGTFLHITFFEILVKQVGGHRQSVLKTLLVFVGFICIAAVALVGHSVKT